MPTHHSESLAGSIPTTRPNDALLPSGAGDIRSPIMSSSHDDREQDHPDIVRQEYADPSRFAARWELWSRRTGPPAYDVAFDALLELGPKRVIEVGCGPGDFAAEYKQPECKWSPSTSPNRWSTSHARATSTRDRHR